MQNSGEVNPSKRTTATDAASASDPVGVSHWHVAPQCVTTVCNQNGEFSVHVRNRKPLQNILNFPPLPGLRQPNWVEYITAYALGRSTGNNRMELEVRLCRRSNTSVPTFLFQFKRGVFLEKERKRPSMKYNRNRNECAVSRSRLDFHRWRVMKAGEERVVTEKMDGVGKMTNASMLTFYRENYFHGSTMSRAQSRGDFDWKNVNLHRNTEIIEFWRSRSGFLCWFPFFFINSKTKAVQNNWWEAGRKQSCL